MMLSFNTLPSPVADALQARVRREGRTLHEVALEALQRGLAPEESGPEELPIDPYENWVESPAFSAALQEFAQLDSTPG